MVNTTVTGGTMSQKEIDAYIVHGKEKYPHKEITAMEIKIDGDYVDIHYHFLPVNFERIRRITGYLVGTTDRWNNAKRAEEHDRVKHAVSSCSCSEQI
ncbi:MAG TPA: hypothetical protein GX401_00030 [Clostridiales bacterium]|nr:hypothetical protein [Clostridiales bacterium]